MDARKVLAELRELLRVCYASWRRSDASSDGRQWQRLSTCSSAADVAAMLFCYSAILLFCYSEVLALCACIVCHEISMAFANSKKANPGEWAVPRRNKPLSVPPGRYARC